MLNGLCVWLWNNFFIWFLEWFGWILRIVESICLRSLYVWCLRNWWCLLCVGLWSVISMYFIVVWRVRYWFRYGRKVYGWFLFICLLILISFLLCLWILLCGWLWIVVWYLIICFIILVCCSCCVMVFLMMKKLRCGILMSRLVMFMYMIYDRRNIFVLIVLIWIIWRIWLDGCIMKLLVLCVIVVLILILLCCVRYVFVLWMILLRWSLIRNLRSGNGLCRLRGSWVRKLCLELLVGLLWIILISLIKRILWLLDLIVFLNF